MDATVTVVIVVIVLMFVLGIGIVVGILLGSKDPSNFAKHVAKHVSFAVQQVGKSKSGAGHRNGAAAAKKSQAKLIREMPKDAKDVKDAKASKDSKAAKEMNKKGNKQTVTSVEKGSKAKEQTGSALSATDAVAATASKAHPEKRTGTQDLEPASVKGKEAKLKADDVSRATTPKEATTPTPQAKMPKETPKAGTTLKDALLVEEESVTKPAPKVKKVPRGPVQEQAELPAAEEKATEAPTPKITEVPMESAAVEVAANGAAAVDEGTMGRAARKAKKERKPPVQEEAEPPAVEEVPIEVPIPKIKKAGKAAEKQAAGVIVAEGEDVDEQLVSEMDSTVAATVAGAGQSDSSDSLGPLSPLEQEQLAPNSGETPQSSPKRGKNKDTAPVVADSIPVANDARDAPKGKRATSPATVASASTPEPVINAQPMPAKIKKTRPPKPKKEKPAVEESLLGVSEGTSLPPVQRVPAPVTLVHAEPAALGCVVLQWMAPECKSAPIDAYFITVHPTGSVMRIPVNDIREVEGLSECTVKGLQPGRPIRFGVQAINTFGAAATGSPSNVVVPKGPPYAIAAVQCEPREGRCFLRWQVPNDGGDPITEYVIDVRIPSTSSRLSTSPSVSAGRRSYRVSTPGAGSIDLALGPDATSSSACGPLNGPPMQSYEVTGLSNGQSYLFTVRACNRFGMAPESRPSPLCVPRGPPNAVSKAKVQVGTEGPQSCLVSWTPPTIPAGEKVTYVVQLLPTDGSNLAEFKCRDNSNQMAIRSLRRGKYTVQVLASNAWGNSPSAAAPGTLVTDSKGGAWQLESA